MPSLYQACFNLPPSIGKSTIFVTIWHWHSEQLAEAETLAWIYTINMSSYFACPFCCWLFYKRAQSVSVASFLSSLLRGCFLPFLLYDRHKSIRVEWSCSKDIYRDLWKELEKSSFRLQEQMWQFLGYKIQSVQMTVQILTRESLKLQS